MSEKETTDSWGWGKIMRYVLLPKPKGSPPAGKKEIFARIGTAVVILYVFFGNWGSSLACDGGGVTDTAKSVIIQTAKENGLLFVNGRAMPTSILSKSNSYDGLTAELSAIRTADKDENGNLTCKAILVYRYKGDSIDDDIKKSVEYNIDYTVEPTSDGNYYVQVRGFMG